MAPLHYALHIVCVKPVVHEVYSLSDILYALLQLLVAVIPPEIIDQGQCIFFHT